MDFRYEVISGEELMERFPGVRTVPQITKEDRYIGGFTELEAFLSEPELVSNEDSTRTVFNADNRGYSEVGYPLFLGDSLGLTDTINQNYPILEKLYDAQMAQIWNHLEVDLTQDRQDMLNADPNTVALMVKTIMWQWLADSVASRAITGILMEYVTNSDLESWYNAVACFETIHAKTYSHIVKQTFVDPNQAILDVYSDMEVLKRSNILVDTFNELANLSRDSSKQEKIEAVYLAVVALYMLESCNFMASFAVTFGIAETGIFQGISQDVVLICRDELLHARGGLEVFMIELQRNPEVFARIKPKIQKIFNEIIKGEEEWTDHLFSEGRQCIGINSNLIKQYVKYTAQDVALTLGLEHETVLDNPLPYMDDYVDTSKVQVAAQELQLTSYLVNAVKASSTQEIDDALSELRDRYL